jgi:hypothetical protein
MSAVPTNRPVPAQPVIPVPTTYEEALDPTWLEKALVSVAHGGKLQSVETTEFIKTTATKIRFAATFEGAAGTQHFCLKGFLNGDKVTKEAGATCILEGDFYVKIAPRLNLRVPEAVAVITDHDIGQSVLITRDLIVAGGQFCSALEPFTVDQMAESLEEFAKLHAGSLFLDEMPWVLPRTKRLAHSQHLSTEELQTLLDGKRGDNLSSFVRSGERLIAGIRALAEKDAARSNFLVHGDAHAGNTFRTPEGAGVIDWQMIQRAGWAIDIAYHLCSALPVEVAEKEERRLLNHYLGVARGHGLAMPYAEDAWLQYRESVMYGYYMWGITRTVAPDVIIEFTDRLGRAAMRHESHALLGIA